MYFNQTPVPAARSLQVLDAYFKWRRTPEGEELGEMIAILRK
jgi:para-nitrobenzyl esterase